MKRRFTRSRSSESRASTGARAVHAKTGLALAELGEHRTEAPPSCPEAHVIQYASTIASAVEVVSAITLGDGQLGLRFKARELALAFDVTRTPEHETFTLETPCHLLRRGQEFKLVLPARHSAAPMPNRDPALIRAVARAHAWWTWIREGEVSSLREIVTRSGLDPAQVTRRLRLAFLAPDLVRRILAGSQPADLTLEKLIRKTELPLSWEQQIQLLG